jgi:hypothetical protein
MNLIRIILLLISDGCAFYRQTLMQIEPPVNKGQYRVRLGDFLPAAQKALNSED